jgi:acyl-CoA thioesterase FadM
VGGTTVAHVHLIFRTLILFWSARRRPALGMRDVGRITLRVLPTDLDILGHMNNGVHLSIMDLGRMDLMIREGFWAKLRAEKMYPVMVSETITFRRSLHLWERFILETRVIGVDDKAVYVEQRFVVDGEIAAQAMTRARFLQAGAGTVSIERLSELASTDLRDHPVPAWALEWAAAVALPSRREAVPSVWED